jgi:hypothetical protein
LPKWSRRIDRCAHYSTKILSDRASDPRKTQDFVCFCSPWRAPQGGTALTHIIYVLLTKQALRRPYNASGCKWRLCGSRPMLDWLVGSFDVFGVAIQNWMVLIALGFVAYTGILLFGRNSSHFL